MYKLTGTERATPSFTTVVAVCTRANQETSDSHTTIPWTLTFKAGLTWRDLYRTNALRQKCLPIGAALEVEGLGGTGVGAAGSRHLA
jgi:hypothetical protein